MIISSGHALTIGKVYFPGVDGMYSVFDAGGRSQTEFRLQILRSSSREEYLKYWKEHSENESYVYNHHEYFYLASID